MERLEPRLCLSVYYDLDIVLQEDVTLYNSDGIVSATFATIRPSATITNFGEVGFAGREVWSERDSVYIIDHESQITDFTTEGNFPYAIDHEILALQVNDVGEAAFVGTSGDFFHPEIEEARAVWGPTGPPYPHLQPINQMAYSYVSPLPKDNIGAFDDLAESVSVSEDGRTAFATLTNNTWRVYLTNERVSAGDLSDDAMSDVVTTRPRSDDLDVRAADGQRVLVTSRGDANTEITLYDMSPVSSATIGKASGIFWDDLGIRPGISDDGSVVAFWGDLSKTGAQCYGVEPGPGFFASVQVGSSLSNRKLVRLTDGAIPSLGYDQMLNRIKFSSFLQGILRDERVGVVRQELGPPGLKGDSLVVAFMAAPEQASRNNPVTGPGERPLLFTDELGLWTVTVDVDQELSGTTHAWTFHPTGARPVMQLGDLLDGVPITNLEVHDPIARVPWVDYEYRNERRGDHQLAFTVTADGQTSIVRAVQMDSDEDGLFDHWEREGGGIDMDQDGLIDLDLSALGADPFKRDLFVEIDWTGPRLGTSEIDAWINELQPGVTDELLLLFEYNSYEEITLHLDAGPGEDLYGRFYSINMGSDEFALQGGQEIVAWDEDGFGERPDIVYFGPDGSLKIPGVVTRSFTSVKEQYLGRDEDKWARELAFHYIVLADFQGLAEVKVFKNNDPDDPNNFSYDQLTPVPAAVSARSTNRRILKPVMSLPTYPVERRTSPLAGHAVMITAGMGAGQIRTIRSNTADRIVLCAPWTTPPDENSQFVVLEGSGGVAEMSYYESPDNHSVPGNDSLVTLGGFEHANGLLGTSDKGPSFEMWQTIAHELGHNFGLRHGGTDHEAYKAESAYQSLMSYSHVGNLRSGIISYAGRNDRTYDDWGNLRMDFANYPMHLGTSDSGLLGSSLPSEHEPFPNYADFLAINNQPPIAHNDGTAVFAGQPVIVDVLANDDDPEDALDPYFVTIVDAPSHGVATVDLASGQITYTSEVGFSGSDGLTYTVEDNAGALSNVATVSFAVFYNQPPIASDDSAAVALNQYAAINVLANDTDPVGSLDPASVAIGTAPSHGGVTIDPSSGVITYTPVNGFLGSDSFTYTVADDLGAVSNTAIVTVLIQQPPVANDDAAWVSAGEPVAVDVLANDSTLDGSLAPSTVAIVDAPEHGILWSIHTFSGVITYIPSTGFLGTDSFTYTVRNSEGAVSNVATVTIRVKAANDAPEAGGVEYGMDEDTTLTVAAPEGVLSNAWDSDFDPLTAHLVDGPGFGHELTLNSDGSFSFTPRADFYGTVEFTYKANDGALDSNVATVTITVNGVEDAPTAHDDWYNTKEGQTLDSGFSGVLFNDYEPDGEEAYALTASLVDGPSNGALTLNANGTFTYTPNADFHGTDSFTYQANDGALDSNVATVTITVLYLQNYAPVAYGRTYEVVEDVTRTIPAVDGVLFNDFDANGDRLWAVLVAGPSHGALTLNLDGSFAYTPDANFDGTDSFTYKANDGELDSNVAQVLLVLYPKNDLPMVVDDAYSIDEDNVLTVAASEGLLANDSDVDGDALTASINGSYPDPDSYGDLALNADGSFTYTPSENFCGTLTFSYKASDGSDAGPVSETGYSIGTVTITVNPVNDAPVANNDTYSVDEDNALIFPWWSRGVMYNDHGGWDGVETLSAMLVSDPSNGVLTFNADGSFGYTPEANFHGTDSFTYKINDGELDSNVATATITVNSVNDAPVALGDTYSIDEDQVLTIAASEGLLANDSDVEGDALSAYLNSLSGLSVSHGVLTLNADGSFTYTPDANFHGTDSFTYQASDVDYTAPGGDPDPAISNLATVTITVDPVNDPPVADHYTRVLLEDDPLPIWINLASSSTLSSDLDGDALTAVIVTDPSHGVAMTDGAFSRFVKYTPDANFHGTDSFTYKVNDGELDSNVATVTLIVLPVNDAPVALSDTYGVDEDNTLTIAAAEGVLANDSDVDGDALTVLYANVSPSNGVLSLNGDGSFTYTPDANFHGTDSFRYIANDGALNSYADVTITVNAMNDAPVALQDDYSVGEDQTLAPGSFGVLFNDHDLDGDALSAMSVSGPSNGVLTLYATGSFQYTPNANFHGTDSFTYKANDGTLDSNVATVTITVIPVNDVPVAAFDMYSVDEDNRLTIAVPEGVLSNDSDVDEDPLTALLLNGPRYGALALNGDGSFTYNPNVNFHGTDSFTYNASDGTFWSSARVTITVNPVNDAPWALSDVYGVDEDRSLIVPAPGILIRDVDVDGDTLTAVPVTDPRNGILTLYATGSFTYTPNANFHGTDSFTYKANDGELDSNVAVVWIRVNAVNDAPMANPDTATVAEDGSVVIAVLTNDSKGPANESGQTLTVTSASALHGTVTINAGTTLTYTPDADYNGADTISYAITDDGRTNGAADPLTASSIVAVDVLNLVDVSGRVFNDLDNDGAFEPGNGDAGIGEVTVRVWDDAMETLFGSTETEDDGTYFLDVNLHAGAYKIVEYVDELANLGLLDGIETAGNLRGTVDNSRDSSEIGISVGDPGTTADATDYLFAEIEPSYLFGTVWRDFNNDGEIDFGETGIEGAVVSLTGTDDRGNTVSQSDLTAEDGIYAFINLRPGTYTLEETQAAGFDDGLESADFVVTNSHPVNGPPAIDSGTNGANDIFSGVKLAPGSTGDFYNFGERPQGGGQIGAGTTATIGFWHNKNGEALIESLNGDRDSTQLGDWLAAMFPNMYGPAAFYDAASGDDDDQVMNLTGKTNAEIADIFQYLHKRNKKTSVAGGPPKVDAQVMAVALATYVTSETLAGGTYAVDYGFETSADGIAYTTFNVLDVLTAQEADDLGLTPVMDAAGNVAILDILLMTNEKAAQGLLFDADQSGSISTFELTLRTLANDLYTAINEGSDI
ncbi:tandem-95 repeat protein [Planctomycetota bacterium]